jgi:hypothetical protein
MAPAIWDVLGIAPTRDRTAIRRAYAAVLKVTNPEEKPAEFKILRNAYERALALAAQPAVTEPLQAQVAAPSGAPVPEPVPAALPALEELPAAPPDLPAASPMQVYGSACGTLERLLRHAASTQAEIETAFAAILAEPVFQLVGVQAQTEQWLLSLIIATMPRSDPLVAPAIAQFHWRQNMIGRRDAARVQAVLRRDDDIKWRAKILTHQSGDREALQALREPPPGQGLLWRLMRPGRAGAVIKLLLLIETDHASLLKEFNQEALVYWRRFAAQPRLPDWTLWVALVSILIFLPWAGVSPNTQGFIMSLGGGCLGVLFVLLAQHFLIAWPRFLWRQRWAARAPLWARLGWWPAIMLMVILAAVLPPFIPVAILLWLGSVLLVLWSLMTGEPDRRPGTMPWQWRILVQELWLGGWWVVMFQFVKLPVYRDMTGPVAAGIVASTFSILPLYSMWHTMSAARRRMVLAAIMFVVVVAGGLLCAVTADTAYVPLACACTASAVLMHRMPSVLITGRLYKIRHFLLAGSMFLGASALAPLGLPWSVVGSGSLLLGVVFTVAVIVPKLR